MRFGTSDIWDARAGVLRNVVDLKSHPEFNRAYFDVGIVVADKILEFTDYIMPVCLPMNPIDDVDALADKFVSIAGWGLTLNSYTMIYY